MNLPHRGSQVAKLEEALTKEVKALETLRQELQQAAADLETPDVGMTDDDLRLLISKQHLAKARVDQAQNRVRRSEEALNAARAAAVAKQQKAEIAHVTALGEAAQEVMTAEIAAATKGLRKAIRVMAEAELARENLNAKLPDDLQISSFETAVLSTPGTLRKEISRTRELHWLHPFGRPYDPEYARKIKENTNGTATISHGGHTTTITKRQFFDRVMFTDWTAARGVSSLAHSLALPGLKGAPAGWHPMQLVSPQDVLAELDRLEAAAAGEPEPEVKIELEPVSPVFTDEQSLKAWEVSQREASSEAA
jgi:hypothetical protein